MQDTLIKDMTKSEFSELLRDILTEYLYSDKKYYYGYDGLAEILGCSMANAANVKLSGLLDGAFTQIGRKIIWDREKVLELAGRKKGGRK